MANSTSNNILVILFQSFLMMGYSTIINHLSWINDKLWWIYYPINRFNTATQLCLSQARTLNSIGIGRFVLDQRASLSLYSAISLRQHSAGRLSLNSDIFTNTEPPVFALTPSYCVSNGEAANTNFIVFGFTRSWLEPTIYRTPGGSTFNLPLHHQCGSLRFEMKGSC